ncbi:hypothetical protein ACHAWF_018238 [Thalassiosira exigua]
MHRLTGVCANNASTTGLRVLHCGLRRRLCLANSAWLIHELIDDETLDETGIGSKSQHASTFRLARPLRHNGSIACCLKLYGHGPSKVTLQAMMHFSGWKGCKVVSSGVIAVAVTISMVSVHYLAAAFGNNHFMRNHAHARQIHSDITTKTGCSSVVNLSLRDRFRYKGLRQVGPMAEDSGPLPSTTSNQLKKCKRKMPKKRKIQFVSWAGKRGMLPHQYYSGVLNYSEYRHWLRLPLQTNASIPSATCDNYFSTTSSLSNTSSAHEKQRDPPRISAKHVQPIYIDDHIIVLNKPSGILSVPGPRRHESLATLAYRYFGKSEFNSDKSQPSEPDHHTNLGEDKGTWKALTAADNKQIDTMVIHRLDRDTSGVLMFARNDQALKQLHIDFKDKTKKRVNKRYVALVCGHWNGRASSSDAFTVGEGEINLPLVRDMERPPFMRVATAETRLQQELLKEQSKNNPQKHHNGYLRMVGKGSKASLTKYRIVSYEYLVNSNRNFDSDGTRTPPQLLPVTRVELEPVTGRTHQLRVHCSAIGHPIVGDSIYGHLGEGSASGGLTSDGALNGASIDLQSEIHRYWLARKKSRNREEYRQHNGNDSAHPDFANDEECMLCLHAYQLSIYHPYTESPLIFECHPPF